MTDTTADAPARDYSETLFLPRTDFPMRAELPKREPEFLERWERLSLYRRLRESAAQSPRFVLHDGPPYANGHLHIGHALNKVLKDIVVRSRQMTGHDANYVPGWDCHGLPIEWRVEEEYRASGRNKDEVPVNDFRRECRAYAENWINIQREEFKRLGVTGDWEHPYTTMAYRAEAVIAGELMKFAQAGQLYRGSKPVMWSIVEKTALAEAEVEYQEHTSHTIFVKFPVRKGAADLTGALVVIWTTTPWTIPGNRAVAFAPHITYGLYDVKSAPEDNWTTPGARLILADALADTAFKAGRIDLAERLRTVTADELSGLVLAHPLHAQGYDFSVPVLHGDFVTEDTGTGFVHIAPGHGADDYNLWIRNRAHLVSLGIDADVPHTVAPDGSYFPHVPLFAGLFVLDDKGKEGAANKAVIDALAAAGGLLGRGRLRHQYPHSWRSKAPLIYRNTPQWFIPMDRPYSGGNNDTLRERALTAISQTAFYPPQGENRLRGMIESRPDWVVSRQRAWGVPISIFIREDGAGGVAAMAPGPDFAHNGELVARIRTAFEAEGADAWFSEGATERFLGGLVEDLSGWRKIDDILDVWFDSGSTHAFVLEERADLGWPAAMYLEGSDQHRGWFHSSLLESCGTRGRAPYDSLLTHGFVLDEQGRKMSKSLGNTVSPQDVIKQSGADILRLWVAQSDYADDLRIGPEILKTVVDTYRKLRNTLRWMLGALGHFREEDRVAFKDMPELERLMLHRLWEVGQAVENGYETYDFKKVFAALMPFLTSDLSAFYFDIRKDALYCDPISSVTRRACLTVIATLFDRVVRWLAPLIPFTTEEAWLHRHPGEDGSVHLQGFAAVPEEWRNDALEERWEIIRRVRRVVTGALELERAGKRIGSSLEAAPEIHIADEAVRAALKGVDLAEICITSGASLVAGNGPAEAFRLDEVPGVAVVPRRAEGRKCARSWKISPDVGADPEFLDITPRDAQAMREWLAQRA